MTRSDQYLIGLHVSKIQVTRDYLQIFFAEGGVLNIFNSHTIENASDPGLTGYEVVGVEPKDTAISLFLLPEGKIKVGLLNSDYQGPEAMTFQTAEGQIFVWP
jgi:hypothetical protein